MLKIENLHVAVGDNKVLNGLDLEIPTGEVHAIMGPNGSGKSTLAHVLAGRPGYEVTAGSVTFDGRDLLALEPEDRAHEGVFLGFQYPVEIPGVNKGFSGGEKKRNQILQMLLLEPRLAVLDETDSGLDIDALKVVANGVNTLRSPERSVVLVTHYQRLLDYIIPDFVHVLVRGRIARSGDKSLALELEKRGYDWVTEEAA